MLSMVAEIFTPDGQRWLLGADGQIHQEVTGPLTAIIENRKGFRAAWGSKAHKNKDHENEVLYWEKKTLPSPELLRALHDVFFSQYNHETMCWWGIPREKFVSVSKKKRTRTKAPPALFFVPTQTCSGASVETVKNTAESEMECFSKLVRVMGDIHSHPGGGMPSRSGVDVTDMSPSSGFFGIFAQREPKIRWYGGVQDALAELQTMDLTKVEPAKNFALLTQGGVSLNKVIREERIRVHHSPKWSSIGGTKKWTKKWTKKDWDFSKTSSKRKNKCHRQHQPKALTLAGELELHDGWTVRGREDAHVWIVIEDTIPPSTGIPVADLREETLITVNEDEVTRVAALLNRKQLKWIDLGPLNELLQDIWLGATTGGLFTELEPEDKKRELMII